jgi:N-acetylgalactosamine kinase
MEASQSFVPVHEQLDQVYVDVNGSLKEKHEFRYVQLKERFKQQFKCMPKFYCRAPGRVNIIGEHIDYCGYSVLPAAIEQDFIMAVCPVEEGEGSNEIVISNIESATYPLIKLTTDPY